MKSYVAACLACGLLSLCISRGAIAQEAEDFGIFGVSEDGNGLSISNGRNTLDLHGLLGGSLGLSTPQQGKSVTIGDSGGLNFRNGHRRGEVRYDERNDARDGNKELYIEREFNSADTDENEELEKFGELFLKSGSKTVSLSGNWRKKDREAGDTRSLEEAVSLLGGKLSDNQIELDLSSDVLFDFDSTGIKPEAARTLSQVAHLIRRAATGTVVIHGHTDSKGSREYNQTLSEQRAAAVLRWLNSFEEIPAPLLKAYGHGEERPVAPNASAFGDSPEGRAKNRRVEIIIQAREL